MAKKMKMTTEQSMAISTLDKPIIISANAGSGKTRTMVDRIVSIIKNKYASISQNLALTFTRSAAGEMKQRLALKLQEYANEDIENKKYYEEQIDELNVADICSLDSFCQKLIKKYFYIINVDPNFSIVDDIESGYLKASALDFTLNKYADNPQFRDLTMILKDTKNLDNINRFVFDFANFAFTLVDYKEFFRVYLNRDYQYKLVMEFLLDRFQVVAEHYKSFFVECKKVIDAKQFECLKPNCDLAIRFFDLFKNFDENEVSYFKQYPQFLSFPRKTKKRDELDKEMQDSMKAELDSLDKEMQEFLSAFSYGDLASTKKHFDNAFNFVELFCEVVQSFIEKYNELKSARNVLDFNDLEDMAIEILKNENVQNDVRSNYKFICVDEFQDTNEKQSALLSFIDKGANTFFVGDPKQSIYKFRQCDLNIFVRLIEKFKQDDDKLFLSFNQNFRSHKIILDFVNRVFDKLMTKNITNIDYENENEFKNLKMLRLKIKGTFERMKKKAKKVNYIDRVCIFEIDESGGKLEVGAPILKKILTTKMNKLVRNFKFNKNSRIYSVMEAQNKQLKIANNDEGHTAVQYIMSFFEKKIKIRDPQTKELRRVRFSDFAILLRDRTTFDTYIDAFNEYNIPVSAKLKINLIELPHIMEIINILRCISNSKQDLPLGASMKYLGNLDEKELFEIRKQYEDGFFFEALENYIQNEDNCQNVVFAKAKDCMQKLQKYKIMARNCTVSQLVNYIVADNNLVNLFLSMDGGVDMVEQLRLFVSKLENKSFDNSIDEFLKFIKNYADAFFVDFSTVSSDNCIQITTIHNSKGLEYPIVIVGGCGRNFNLSKRRDFVFSKELGIACFDADLDKHIKYPTISHNAIHLQNLTDELLEQMRVFYVAITRPKEYLALIGTCNNDKLKHEEYSILKCKKYFDFIRICDLKERIIQIKNKKSVVISKNPQKFDNFDELYADEFIDKLDNEYKYLDACTLPQKKSVSAILKEFNTGKDFFDEDFDATNLSEKAILEGAELGIAYHSAMENYDTNITDNEFVQKIKANLKKEQLEAIDIDKLIICKNHLDKLLNGCNCKLYKEQKFMMNIPYNEIFSNSNISEKIVVQGIVDLMIECDDKVILIDYKTNKIHNAEKLKEEYATQIALYRCAIEKAFHKNIDAKLYSFSMNKFINYD